MGCCCVSLHLLPLHFTRSCTNLSSASAAKQGGVPKFVDDAFDASYNATLIANDLPHVRWGRIDYLNVTYLTTKWSLWRCVSLVFCNIRACVHHYSQRAPMIMFISDRGQTLRFVGPNEIRLRNEGLREALLTDVWKYKQPWKSSFSPGGSKYVDSLSSLPIFHAHLYYQ